MPSASPHDLRHASDRFVATVELITPDHWPLATPCPDWPVRQLVGHVVAASAMAAALVRGAGRDEAIARLGVDEIGEVPVDDTRRVLDDQVVAFEGEADRLDDLRCHHPAGPVSGRQLLELRIADLVVHAWDLAVAIGADTRLDPDLVEVAWTAMRPMAPFIGRLGVFGAGPSGSMDDEAPLQARLLDLTGRRP